MNGTSKKLAEEVRFDWASDDSIAVQDQPAIAVYPIAVYPNAAGQVVLRRERSWDEEDDCFIHISQGNVLTVIAHMLRAAEMHDIEVIRALGGGGYEDVQLQDLIVNGAVAVPNGSVSKDRTAAERKRRRRQKLRDTGETVTRDSGDNTKEAPELRLVAAE